MVSARLSCVGYVLLAFVLMGLLGYVIVGATKVYEAARRRWGSRD